MVSATENEVIIDRWYENLNQHNLDAVMTFFAPNFVFFGPGAIEAMDAGGWRRFFMTYYRAFPDLTFVEEHSFAGGNNVSSRWTAHGTQQNEFLSIPPTGQQVTTLGISVFQIADGKITKLWTEFDQLGLARQLGAILVRGRLTSG